MSDCLVRESFNFQRNHRRFLLKQLSFTQQFASMYFVRLGFLKNRTLETMGANVEEGAAKAKAAAVRNAPITRILELPIGSRCACFGTIFKQVANLRRFLDEYQKELVRIDAGDDDDMEGGGEDMESGMMDGEAPGAGAQEITTNANQLTRQATERAAGIGVRPTCLISEKDELILEDDSGRVELRCNEASRLVTGVVAMVVGVLDEKGVFDVEAVIPCGAAPQVPHPLLNAPLNAAADTPAPTPRYLGFVSGLNIGAAGQAAANIDLLVDYLCGNLGDEDAQRQSACISRLVIGGNCIDITDEWKLKNKVKLDPQDHLREAQSTNTIANSMKQLDHVLAQLAETIEVDVMPGDTDPSNAFFPQQPVHPIMLKTTAKKSTTKLVTNPYEFKAKPKNQDGAVDALVHVTAGQNVDDVLRQVDSTAIDVMTLMIDSSCSCPTAPNSLVCYPFEKQDPFVFLETPHVYVACNQESFETKLHESENGTKTRLVTVPSFSCRGELVLIDLNSPQFAVTSVKFA